MDFVWLINSLPFCFVFLLPFFHSISVWAMYLLMAVRLCALLLPRLSFMPRPCVCVRVSSLLIAINWCKVIVQQS